MVNRALHIELQELLDEVAPPLIDLDELHRLVAADEDDDFDGECVLHEGCRPIFARRLL
ncbi:hypothetical protein QT381_02865 [Galbitalea sp. SE-J8]|uniref:hypothetical protein n=1 Tax=Galbitalea sp. SE-J8 TaxID=3054952 RepID=UPI00259C82BF|nr:hypothetical protein [Galbitalea sp. SE-J8]MDM4761946.1 hypothetical protein [Galbitalea sp. SE-J8]